MSCDAPHCVFEEIQSNFLEELNEESTENISNLHPGIYPSEKEAVEHDRFSDVINWFIKTSVNSLFLLPI